MLSTVIWSNDFTRSMKSCITVLPPSKYLPTLDKTLVVLFPKLRTKLFTSGSANNAFIHSLICTHSLDIQSTAVENTSAISMLSLTKSLRATAASPISAVTSRAFISRVPKIVDSTLKAALSVPETIIRIVSRTANKPLKEHLSLSATPSLKLIVSEKVCIASSNE